MKRFFLILMGAVAVSLAEESFITIEEYGKELYKNPRGIGCIACHGESGKGKVIATYREKNIQKTLKSPDITQLSFQDFSANTLKDQGVMPKYHLTKEELQAIYNYLQSKNKAKSRPKSSKANLKSSG